MERIFAFCSFPKLKFIVEQLIIAHPIKCGLADLLVKSARRLLKRGQIWLKASSHLDLRENNPCFNTILMTIFQYVQKWLKSAVFYLLYSIIAQVYKWDATAVMTACWIQPNFPDYSALFTKEAKVLVRPRT